MTTFCLLSRAFVIYANVYLFALGTNEGKIEGHAIYELSETLTLAVETLKICQSASFEEAFA